MIIFILEDLCSHFGCLLCSDRLFILSLLSYLIYLSFQNSLFRINFNSQLYKIYYSPKSLVIFDFICKIVHFINFILSWIYLEYQNMHFLKNLTFYFYCSHIFARPQILHLNSHFLIRNLQIEFDHQLLYILYFLHFFDNFYHLYNSQCLHFIHQTITFLHFYLCIFCYQHFYFDNNFGCQNLTAHNSFHIFDHYRDDNYCDSNHHLLFPKHLDLILLIINRFACAFRFYFFARHYYCFFSLKKLGLDFNSIFCRFSILLSFQNLASQEDYKILVLYDL